MSSQRSMVDFSLSLKMRLFLSNHKTHNMDAIVLKKMIPFLLRCFIEQRKEHKETTFCCWFFHPRSPSSLFHRILAVWQSMKIWSISSECLLHKEHQFGLRLRVRTFFRRMSAVWIQQCKRYHMKKRHFLEILVFQSWEKVLSSI